MGNIEEAKIAAALRQHAGKLRGHPLCEIGKQGKIDPCQLLFLLALCAILNQSPEYACPHSGFSADALYYHLNDLSLDRIEEILKQFVYGKELKLLRRRRPMRQVILAIDYTDEMYYGERPCEGVVGTKHKAGSNWARRYLTIKLVNTDGPFMLWAAPMKDRKCTPELLEAGLRAVERMGLHPHLLLLDREFNSGEILDFVGLRYQYIIPSDHDGKFYRRAKGLRLPAIIYHWEVGGVETQLVIIEEEKKKYGYLTNIPKQMFVDDVDYLSDTYSMRWAIESGFRDAAKFSVPTNAKGLSARYLYFCVSLLVYNFWAWINLFMGWQICKPKHLVLEKLRELLAPVIDGFLRKVVESDWWVPAKLTGALEERVFSPEKAKGGDAAGAPPPIKFLSNP